MNRYFLMHQRNGEVWYILEKDVDYIGAWYDGKPSIMDTEVVYEAESLPEILHQMQNNKDRRFYVVLDWIDSRGRTRSEEYPHHRSICTLAGFIPEVCNICQSSSKPYFADWQVEYCSELWVFPDEERRESWIARATRVIGYTEKMKKAVDDYIAEKGLIFDQVGE